jgi:hypothetical protein
LTHVNCRKYINIIAALSIANKKHILANLFTSTALTLPQAHLLAGVTLPQSLTSIHIANLLILKFGKNYFWKSRFDLCQTF